MSITKDHRKGDTMTATEELRRMLDERGVEWRERVWGGKHSVTTFWHARGVRWHYRENRFGELRLHADGLAPEQAIDATLGAGTCQLKPWEMERDTGFYDCMQCDCGMVADVGDWAEWHFCPNCGRRVTEVDE